MQVRLFPNKSKGPADGPPREPPYRCRMTSFWRRAASMTQPWTSRQVLFRNEDNSDLETLSIKKKAQCISVDNESSCIEILKDVFLFPNALKLPEKFLL